MNDILKKASDIVKKSDLRNDITKSFFESKTEIKEDSIDYKFFFYALNGMNSDLSELLNDKTLSKKQYKHICDIAAIANLMAAHVMGEDKTSFIE